MSTLQLPQLPRVSAARALTIVQDGYTRTRRVAGYASKYAKLAHAALTSPEAHDRYQTLYKVIRDLVTIAWLVLKAVGTAIDKWAIDPDAEASAPPELPPVVTKAVTKVGDRIVGALDALAIGIDKVRDRLVMLLHPEYRRYRAEVTDAIEEEAVR